jgi:uncharacterized protein
VIDVARARALYAELESAHDFDHILRVLRLAERIGKAEGADLEIVRTAALLHDIGRSEEARTGRCHAQIGAEMAAKILSQHPQDRVQAVVEAIAAHRFRGGETPRSLEARVLFDADKLDAIGAIGIARAYAVAGIQGQRLWAQPEQAYAARNRTDAQADWTNAAHTPVHEYLFKLVRLKDGMLTAAGRLLAEDRHLFMVSFFERLAQEVAGER